MNVFRRKIYDKLKKWKDLSDGRSAVLIEGARRIGKTTVAIEFAKNEYESHIFIDFSRLDKDLERIFRDNIRNLDNFFFEIQSMMGVRLHERKSLIIFDEVQLFPFARQMIKHLVADGRYDYLETGSLLSIKQNVEGILIPSEEKHLEMHPMDFEEFLWATGDDFTMDLIRRSFHDSIPLGQGGHKRVMKLYSIYMLVGGMPQAVKAYLETNNYDAIEEEKENILDLYLADAAKISYGGSKKAVSLLKNIPSTLSRHEKTFSPSDLREESKTREYISDADWLSESRMVNICHRCTDPNPAIDLNLDENSFKLYLVDTGLLFTLAFRSNDGSRSEIYSQMLSGKMGINKGMFFENMVAQELIAAGHSLVFCRFDSPDTVNSQEVDFIIASGNGVIPLEVKSGKISTRHVSLDRFMRMYGRGDGRAYVIHSKDLRVEGNVTYVPIYMTALI